MQPGQVGGVPEQGHGRLLGRGRGVGERAVEGEGGAQRSGHLPGGRLLCAELGEIPGSGRRKIGQREYAFGIQLREEIVYRPARGALQRPCACQIQCIFSGDARNEQIQPEER